ncbi:MAG: hypothetical protein D6781_06335 [Verrucomicrobia bacterium]|nr:MAG: hypothetical protein D6781_06335 [Verrucomicrobiota bacterium]
MTAYRDKIILLPQNRVWRTYPGGAILDRLAGRENPTDSHYPEDWIASITEARNPGEHPAGEGISQVLAGGQRWNLRELITSDPEYFLGREHLARHGANPMLLVKFLDSAIRLHLQAHPTREFARARLGSPSGKTEAYYVLAVREDITEPYIYMGFQRPPSREALRTLIEKQDIPALEACFDKIPVRPGDTILVPGGWPHALGEGVFLIEIQEPSDLVVRFEFERGGYRLPESARFMGRDIDLALDIIDLTAHPQSEIDEKCRCRPRRLRDFGEGSWQEELIGPQQTDCFRVLRTHLRQPVEKHEGCFHILIVTHGSCTVAHGDERYHLKTYDKVLVPAGLGPIRIEPETQTEIIECLPPL